VRSPNYQICPQALICWILPNTERLKPINRKPEPIIVEDLLRNMIVKATHNKNVVVTPECTFKDLGVDSMSVINILVALEDKLGIDIEDNDLKTIRNMGSFIDYLKRKAAEKNIRNS
jgi:acyl carrier protein